MEITRQVFHFQAFLDATLPLLAHRSGMFFSMAQLETGLRPLRVWLSVAGKRPWVTNDSCGDERLPSELSMLPGTPD